MQDGEEQEGTVWPAYVDFLSTFVFVLIVFIGSLLFLLSGDIQKGVMDGLVNPVEADCKSAGLPCSRDGSKIVVPLTGKVEFGTNQVRVQKPQEDFLRQVGKLFERPGIKRIVVKGTADMQRCKSDPFCNWDISARRALEVIKFYYDCIDCGYGEKVKKLLVLSGEGDTSSTGVTSSDRRVDIILDFNANR